LRRKFMSSADFGFILHPLSIDDIYRKLKFMRRWPDSLVKTVIKTLPPLMASHITGITSPYGSVEGCFVAVTLTSEQMVELPPEVTLRKIIAAGRKAAKAGAKIIGLGAMTAVVGDGGVSVARSLNIAVTTGNSYTIATALEGVEKAAALMGLELGRAQVAILGATGSIGRVCASILARKANYLTLIARNVRQLEKLAEKLLDEHGLAVKVTPNVHEAVKEADIIIAVSSSTDSLIEPEDLKPGAIVCDVARPRDVSLKVAQKRDDVLIIEGGVVEVPGDVNFNFDFGFPPQTAYACMAETMILALEKRYENYSLGREIDIAKVDEISALATKHGFRLAGFRSFERALAPEDIERIKIKAHG
jgi:fatty aldehyde-generating acyl-ACP reductase